MQPKFTPGPWRVVEERGGVSVETVREYDQGGAISARIDLETYPNAVADARLIAAAPELYAALEAAEALLKLHGYPAFKNSDSIRAQARAALRKANGDAA